MNLAFSLDDFGYFDFTETVTYERRDLAGNVVTTYTGVLALKRPSRGSLLAAGQSQGYVDSARWQIQASMLPVVPRRGDRIVSTSNDTWEIATDTVDNFATRYEVETGKIA